MNRGSKVVDEMGGVPHLHASMRPRFMNRGSGLIRGGHSYSQPRFNEAPIHESGK